MILDENLEFCDATALAGGTGRQLVGDVVPLSVARDLGAGAPLYLVIQVATTFTSAGAATVVFSLVSDDAAAIATNGTASEHFLTTDFSLAQLVAGNTLVCAPLPHGGIEAYETYLGIIATVGTAALTAGAINAFLTPHPAAYKAYADAI